MFSNHNDYCEKENYNMTNMNLGSIFAEGVLFDISAMSLSHSHSVSHPHTGVTYSLSFESSIFSLSQTGTLTLFCFSFA